MFRNLGRRPFFLVQGGKKEHTTIAEGNIVSQVVSAPISSSKFTPDEIRNQRMEFARLSQKEKAA